MLQLPICFQDPPVAPAIYYTSHLLHNPPVTQPTYYTTYLLHNPPVTQPTCYTTYLLHNLPFTQHTCYTTHLITNPPVTQPSFYTTHLLQSQPIHSVVDPCACTGSYWPQMAHIHVLLFSQSCLPSLPRPRPRAPPLFLTPRPLLPPSPPRPGLRLEL